VWNVLSQSWSACPLSADLRTSKLSEGEVIEVAVRINCLVECEGGRNRLVNLADRSKDVARMDVLSQEDS